MQHHELTGGKLSRITKNAVKLSAVFQVHGNPFESADDNDVQPAHQSSYK